MMKTLKDALLNDFHIHTYLSECCSEKEIMVPSNIIDKAQRTGYHSIGFSDHYWENGFECIRKLRRDLEELHPGIKVLVGCEADLLDEGEMTITREEIEELELDYVILATNHFHLDIVRKPDNLSPKSAAAHWLKFLRYGIMSGIADIIPHPILNLHNALGDMNRVVDSVKDEEIMEVLEMAAAREIAMDINPRLFENPLWKPEIQVRFYSLCKKAGVKIAPASDAHAIAEIGDTLRLEPWALKTGLEADDFIDGQWLETHGRKNR